MYASDPSKRWAEKFFLAYSVYWMGLFGGVVVTGVYERFGDVEYMALGLAVALPSLLPLFVVGNADKGHPVRHRFWFKAVVWVAIYSYVGNYFWTHYFFHVLGARYTFPIAWNLNGVPICLYLITHAYFLSYHTFATLALRWFWSTRLYSRQGRTLRCVLTAAAVYTLGFTTAVMEAATISSVPYYTFDPAHMYTVGATFYGIYFYVSYPMYARIDEFSSSPVRWTAAQAALDSLAAGMLAFIVLDLWRLVSGWLIIGHATAGLPWM